MILVIDNYDSFTFNLVQALQAAGAEVRVVRNDAIDRAGIEALAADPAAELRGIVVSPGPGDPASAGVSVAAIEVAGDRGDPAARRLPRDAVDGGRVRRLDRPGADAGARRGLGGHPRRRGPARGHAAGVHGRALPLAGRGRGDAAAGAAGDRDERGRPGSSWGSATSRLPLEGVQFHPESVLTPQGPHLLANFLRQAGEGEASRLDDATGSFATAGLAESGVAAGAQSRDDAGGPRHGRRRGHTPTATEPDPERSRGPER